MDKKEYKTAEEERVALLIAKALEEEMGEPAEDIPDVTITREELQELVRNDRKKRMKKRLRYISAAAAAVLVFAAIIYVAWPTFTTPADADKNDKKVVEEQNGNIVIDDEVGNGEIGGAAVEFTDWNKVLEYKEDNPEVYVPGYVPEGYEFERFNIQEYAEACNYIEYVFKSENQKIISINQVTPNEKDAAVIKQADYILEVEGISVYMKKDQTRLLADFQKENAIITVSGEITEIEIRKIVKSIY